MSEIIGRGAESDPLALKLFTTYNRNFIANERPESDLHPEALIEARKIMRGISPSAKCRSLTALYNCVGMTFASRRTQIDIEKLSMILADDEYNAVPESEAMEGDVVEYRREGVPQHVGIVYQLKDVSLMQDRSNVEMWILSQWGQNGEYLHKVREVPVIYGNELRFWSERRAEP